MSKRAADTTAESTGATPRRGQRRHVAPDAATPASREGESIILEPPTSEEIEATVRLLRSWREGDAEEQRETWGYLKKALDEDRPSGRKLFP